ncbi:DUF2939 domain-containing protein [Thauera humireducens]|uniref:DUF2939 domain-containing protein n=1 Tax=Thauera humireducens TaxID=1134435 RepID=UPI003C76E3BB
MAALLGTGGYWYFSPYLTLQSMKAAAEAKDAEKLNTYVDYPKLRGSFKNDLNARLAENLPSGDNELARRGGGAGHDAQPSLGRRHGGYDDPAGIHHSSPQ